MVGAGDRHGPAGATRNAVLLLQKQEQAGQRGPEDHHGCVKKAAESESAVKADWDSVKLAKPLKAD